MSNHSRIEYLFVTKSSAREHIVAYPDFDCFKSGVSCTPSLVWITRRPGILALPYVRATAPLNVTTGNDWGLWEIASVGKEV